MLAAASVARSARRVTQRYPWGVCQNRLAAAVRAVLSSPGPRRRRRTKGSPGSPTRILGNVVGRCHERKCKTRADPRLSIPNRGQRYPSSDRPQRRIPSTNGCEASLASRPGRAPGLALAGEFRDMAARHPAGGRRRAALPDRRAERLRQGLARVALSLADQPDPRPDRRLQRPGRVRHRHHARRSTPARPSLRRPATATARAMAPAAARVLRPRSGSSRPASAARAGRPTSTRATRSRTSSSGRPTASRTRPACRSRSARGMPTTRSSCTAGWASARPT